MPLEYIRWAKEAAARRGMTPCESTCNETAPLTPLKKPLSRCRIALIASGGIDRHSQATFEERDLKASLPRA